MRHAWMDPRTSAEDWRNRDKAAEYERALSDMIDRTSTSFAPWVVVPANDKLYARIAV